MKIFHSHIVILVSSKIFSNFMLLCVFLNTVVLAMDGLYFDQNILDFLRTSNLFFVYLFTFEMALKICAFGVRSNLINKYYIL